MAALLTQRSRLLLKASVPLAFYSHQQQQWRSLSESVVPDITLYQYKICPYCSRPKTLLDYLRVPYKAVEVNPLTKSQISFSADYKKVPIVSLEGEVFKVPSDCECITINLTYFIVSTFQGFQDHPRSVAATIIS